VPGKKANGTFVEGTETQHGSTPPHHSAAQEISATPALL